MTLIQKWLGILNQIFCVMHFTLSWFKVNVNNFEFILATSMDFFFECWII